MRSRFRRFGVFAFLVAFFGAPGAFAPDASAGNTDPRTARIERAKKDYLTIWQSMQAARAELKKLRPVLEKGSQEYAAARKAYAEQSSRVRRIAMRMQWKSSPKASPQVVEAQKWLAESRRAHYRVKRPVLGKVRETEEYRALQDVMDRMQKTLADMAEGGEADAGKLQDLTKAMSECGRSMREIEDRALAEDAACESAAMAVADAEREVQSAIARAKASEAMSDDADGLRQEYEAAKQERDTLRDQAAAIKQKYAPLMAQYNRARYTLAQKSRQLGLASSRLTGLGFTVKDGQIAGPK